MQFCFLTPILAFLIGSAHAEIKTVQILHTNDLHASLRTAGAPAAGEFEMGGWDRIKWKMDELTAAAQAKGIETIRLDAGDFFEGTLDYFPDHGKHILEAFQSMGYDAAALGNHDWLMGASSLNLAFSTSPFSFPILSANVHISKAMTALKNTIVPFKELVRNGIKFGIMGLSTHESLYRWVTGVDSRRRDLKILDYQDTTSSDGEVTSTIPGIANSTAQTLRSKNNVVIALTHIGFIDDQILAENSKDLDLIVGGHSHSFLETLNVATNQSGREIPIVQTGVNGNFIGRVLIDINVDAQGNNLSPPKVQTYELVPVYQSMPLNEDVKKKVAAAEVALSELKGPTLNDEIGKSEVRLLPGDDGPSAYGKFVVEAMREALHTDIGLDIGKFHGNTAAPAGTVTRRTLMELYPRKFEVEQNEGLYVYQTTIPGWVLEVGIKAAVKWGAYLSLSGVTFDVDEISEEEFKQEKANVDRSQRDVITRFRASKIRINGEKVCLLCGYSMAAPESLIRGAYGISPLFKLLFKHGHSSGITIWDASIAQLKKIGTIPKLKEGDHYNVHEFSNRYQLKNKMNRGNSDQYHSAFNPEGMRAPWSIENPSYDGGLQDLMKQLELGPEQPDPKH